MPRDMAPCPPDPARRRRCTKIRLPRRTSSAPVPPAIRAGPRNPACTTRHLARAAGGTAEPQLQRFRSPRAPTPCIRDMSCRGFDGTLRAFLIVDYAIVQCVFVVSALALADGRRKNRR